MMLNSYANATSNANRSQISRTNNSSPDKYEDEDFDDLERCSAGK